MQHEQDTAAERAGALVGVGASLRSAREARGESVLDAAHALKLAPRQIEAIELERFDQLPGPAFVRGFVRNYARYLGIDAEPLLAGLRRDAPPQPVRLAPVTNATGAMPQGLATRSLARPAMSVVSVLLLSLAVGWYFDWFKVADAPPATVGNVVPVPPRVTEPAPRPVAPPTVMPSPEAARTAAADDRVALAPAESETAGESAAAVPQDSPSAQLADGGTPSDAAAPGSERPPADGAAVTPPVATAQPDAEAATRNGAQTEHGAATTRAATDAAPAVGPSGAAQLVFRLAGESWIQVRDKAGVVVYTGIGAPGTTRTVQGEPPFAIVVGNATQVTLEYDGRPVDLQPHTRSGGVARMTLE
jgi:cytoskeleton protein RodZ